MTVADLQKALTDLDLNALVVFEPDEGESADLFDTVGDLVPCRVRPWVCGTGRLRYEEDPAGIPAYRFLPPRSLA